MFTFIQLLQGGYRSTWVTCWIFLG